METSLFLIMFEIRSLYIWAFFFVTTFGLLRRPFSAVTIRSLDIVHLQSQHMQLFFICDSYICE